MNTKSKVRIECSQGCSKTFKANLFEVPHGDGVKQYFQCTHCNKVYNVCKITPAGLKIRDQLQAAAKDNNRNLVAKLQQKLKEETTRL